MQPSQNKLIVSFLLTLTIYLVIMYIGIDSWYIWRFIGMLGLFMIILMIMFRNEETIYKSDVMHFIDEETMKRMNEIRDRFNAQNEVLHSRGVEPSIRAHKVLVDVSHQF